MKLAALSVVTFLLAVVPTAPPAVAGPVVQPAAAGLAVDVGYHGRERGFGRHRARGHRARGHRGRGYRNHARGYRPHARRHALRRPPHRRGRPGCIVRIVRPTPYGRSIEVINRCRYRRGW